MCQTKLSILVLIEDEEEEEIEEESSEGESEPPESDEDTYVKSERKLKRVKCSFLDDEAEDEDEIPDFEKDTEDKNKAKDTEQIDNRYLKKYFSSKFHYQMPILKSQLTNFFIKLNFCFFSLQ